MNEYGKRFYELLEKYKNVSLLKKESVLSDFVCYRDNFPQEILIETQKLACTKARYVSKKNQKGEVRSEKGVIANVFKGIMAELVAQIYLMQVCGLPTDSVKRYDLERESFKYDPQKEYDVGIFNNGVFYEEIGVKTSKIAKDNFEDFLKNQHCIIAKYKYSGRTEDHNTPYYLGLITVYKDTYVEEKFVDEYMQGNIFTYIVSGATFSEMTGRHSSNNIKMNQSGTTYNLGVRSYYVGDADECSIKMNSHLNGGVLIDYEYSKDQAKRIMAYMSKNNPYHLIHLFSDCKYLAGLDEIVTFDKLSNARNEGGRNICNSCMEKVKNM